MQGGSSVLDPRETLPGTQGDKNNLEESLKYWSGQPFPSPGDLPDPRIEHGSPALQAYSLPLYGLSQKGIPLKYQKVEQWGNFQSHLQSTPILLGPSSLQLTLTNLLIKASQGFRADTKITLIFIRLKASQVHFTAGVSELPSGASGAHPEAASLGFMRSPPKVSVREPGSQLPLLEKAVAFPFKQHTLSDSGFRVPESEAICFCCI